MAKKTKKKKERGFTLIEIMVVVVIIGLLAALVGPEVWSLLAAGQEDIAAAQCERYYDLVVTWKLLTRSKQIPADLYELEGPLKEGAGPFTKIEPDPWGGQYVIEAEGNRFRIVSPGPDGLDGNDDDIVYPKREDD